MDKNKTKSVTKKYLVKLISIVLMLTLLLDLTAAYIGADSFYTVRINYLYVDGSHAHDPYIATSLPIRRSISWSRIPTSAATIP